MNLAWDKSDFGNRKCGVCGASNLEIFFRQEQIPVFCNVLWSTPEEAIRCPRGDIILAFCGNCGFISNLAFDASLMEYSADYENSLHYSPRFQQYAESLAQRLINDYDLHGKNIIEIGCGKGDFLMMLCRIGRNKGIGFDRSYVPGPEHEGAGLDITFVRDFYSPQYADHYADLICCRHVLEHFDRPTDYLRTIKNTIKDGDNTALFFEVPNSLHTFRRLAVWDIIYEHPSYFAPLSLKTTFRKAGFSVRKTSEEFEGQFLTVDASLGEANISLDEVDVEALQSLQDDIRSFADKFEAKQKEWSEILEYQSGTSKKIVVWGSGSKGVTFMNLIANGDQVEYAVDINPRKQGKFIPGTGQRIVAPEYLKDDAPNVIIVMNPIYKEEVQRVTGNLGINPELIVA